MGEDLTPSWTEFNGSLRIESRAERLTSEAGAVILREVMERLGVVPWMVGRLRDPRDPRLITHPLAELLCAAVLLIAQGWRDRDDADALWDDAALRLAVSTRRGISPLWPAQSLPAPSTLQDVVRRAYDQGLRGDDVWRYVLEGSQRSNAGVDAALGISR